MREITDQELDAVAGGVEASQIPGAIAAIGLLGTITTIGTVLIIGATINAKIKDFFGIE